MRRVVFATMVFFTMAYSLLLLDNHVSHWLLQDVAAGTPLWHTWSLWFVAGP